MAKLSSTLTRPPLPVTPFPSTLNLTVLPAGSNFGGCKKELFKLYIDLKRMVDRGEQVSPVYTIKGVGGQEFVAEAMRRMAHLFPGGIFAWAFDKETTCVMGYFRRLVEVIFPNEVCMRLKNQCGDNVQRLGSAIIEELENRAHATCLLILNHADILNLGEKERNIHAMELGTWLRQAASGRVKILITSSEVLGWSTGGMIDLEGLISREHGYIFVNDIKKGVHKYFAQAKEPIPFYGVPAENIAFVERSDILASMKAALDACRILALRGLGGMGKTQLMLQYCYLHRTEYDHVFWLEVDSWNTAVESFRKLAIKLGMNERSTNGEDSEEKIIDWVQCWFHKKTKWLLLLDNADNDEMDKKVFKLLPRIGGNIIFTTRMYVPENKVAVIHIDKMQEHEAIVLLFGVRSMDLIDQTKAKFIYAQMIVTELDCMPLAINLARAYTKRTRTSFKDYLIKFNEEKKRVNLLDYCDKYNLDHYEYTVTTVWQLSFERIRALNPTTLQVLKACAFFHPENIPVHLFKRQFSMLELMSFSVVPPNQQDSEEFSDAIEEAITMLVEFSFVTRITREMEGGDEDEDEDEDPASDLLKIHRLVQKVVYDAIDDEQKLYWARHLATALSKGARYDDYAVYAPGTRSFMDAYLSHIRHFASLLGDLSQKPLISKDLSELLDRTIWYLIQHGAYVGVEELAQFSIRVSDAAYGSDHPSTTIALNKLAIFYYIQGKYDEAEPLYQQALAIREKVLGSEHPDTAESLNNLALFYETRGKYKEAVEPLYKRALAIYEKGLGLEHPSTTITLNNMADLYESQGKYDEAEPLYQRALAIREKVLGLEHPDTATTLNNMAWLYTRQGKYDEAEPLYQRALEIREKVLGFEHPSTVASLNNMAGLYENQGKYSEAEPLYKRALAIKEKVLGLVHPSTAASLNNMAGLYESQGKYSEAEPLYIRALAIREKVLGLEHLYTATTLNNMALLYTRQGKYDEAEPLYKRALAIRKKVLGLEHPSTLTTLDNLAWLRVSRQMRLS